jgi:hypothetical protein
MVDAGLEEKKISFDVICGANKSLATVTGITDDDGVVASAKITGTTSECWQRHCRGFAWKKTERNTVPILSRLFGKGRAT